MTAGDRQTDAFQTETGSHEQSIISGTVGPEFNGREESEIDMQWMFDPWMGFSHSLESYGLTLPPGESYY
jgi:hypothetical protein